MLHVRIPFVLITLVAALLLVSCGGPAGDETQPKPQTEGEQPRQIKVGFSQIGAESAWRTAETDSIRSEAEKRGVKLQFSDAQQKQENQIKALRGFITMKVDAIILAPVVETGWEPVLREIKRAGIPVILVDRGVDVEDDALYTTLIASDFVEEGRMAARWLVERTGGSANVVEIKGTTGSAPAIDRERGFHEIIDERAEMTIIKSQTGEFTRAKGKEVMEAFLKAEGDAIDAVYAHNDDMALGAIQAIEEAGFEPGEDIIIVSIDGVRAAFEAMIDGTLNCTVECNPLLGPMAFDAVEAVLAGEDLPKMIVVEDRLFDQTTAAAELPNRKY
jgi:simple sugar transport system substrate-binding protein